MVIAKHPGLPHDDLEETTPQNQQSGGRKG
jgi:hypothetical protein